MLDAKAHNSPSRRLIFAILVGATTTSLPFLAYSQVPGLQWFVFLWAPGLIVGLTISGNAYHLSIVVVALGNAIFYSWLAYVCLRALHGSLDTTRPFRTRLY